MMKKFAATLLLTTALTAASFAAQATELNPVPATDATITANNATVFNATGTSTLVSNQAGTGSIEISNTTGTTTLTGALVANNNATLNSTSGGNSLVVAPDQNNTVGANVVNHGTTATGGMLVNGSLGVNGNIYSHNTTGNASVGVANNNIGITGATNAVTLTSDNDASAANGRSNVTLTPTTANVTVTNAAGNTHGLAVGTSQTVLSGGTTSTSLVLNDAGATFVNTPGGAPAHVTGVADGYNPFDAVNYRQLTKVQDDSNRAAASVTAMANIPQVDQSKDFSLGMGYGNYDSEQALALGGSYRFQQATIIKASVGSSGNGAAAVGVGAAYSW